MASTGIIQRRYAKHELIANPPLVGELVFAIDTQEFGTLINQKIVWRTFKDSVESVNSKTGKVELNKTDIGLSNVDNTADINKPLSEKMISALSLKLDVTGTANNSNKLNGLLPNYYLTLDTGYTQNELNKMLNLKAPLTDVYTQKFINDNFEKLSMVKYQLHNYPILLLIK